MFCLFYLISQYSRMFSVAFYWANSITFLKLVQCVLSSSTVTLFYCRSYLSLCPDHLVIIESLEFSMRINLQRHKCKLYNYLSNIIYIWATFFYKNRIWHVGLRTISKWNVIFLNNAYWEFLKVSFPAITLFTFLSHTCKRSFGNRM